MPIMGEAEANAKHLEKLLLLALEKDDSVLVFAKQHLYRWYINELGAAYMSENPKIKKYYEGN